VFFLWVDLFLGSRRAKATSSSSKRTCQKIERIIWKLETILKKWFSLRSLSRFHYLKELFLRS